MFSKLRNWRQHRTLARHPIADASWQHALARCAPAQRLGASDQAELRVLATLFLHRKSFEPVQDLQLSDADRTLIAVHAAVPILKLGLDWYDGWYSLIIYPHAFTPRRQRMDAAGVVHDNGDILAGEAWGRGPVILSQDDIQRTGETLGHNVIIHEMAHKLDMQNGDANGFPPLHRRMSRQRWSCVFTQAWDELHAARRQGRTLPINSYGLTSPAEFFAVLSEHFFEQPQALRRDLPQVHRQLSDFYRQY